MFITHCGRLSMLEAVYRGVPVVGIPLIMDQPSNLKLILDRKGGVHLDYHTLSKESILQAVKKVLGNKSYAVNMKKLSTIFRDQADTALDRAVFWTEYVIRHKGAPHLRPASTELHWHQYLLLDVILVIVFALVITFLITRCMLIIFLQEIMLLTCIMKLAALLLTSIELQIVQCAKILALLNLATPSHHVFNKVLTRTLAARGHQVSAIIYLKSLVFVIIGCVRQHSTIQIKCSVSMLTVEVNVNKYVTVISAGVDRDPPANLTSIHLEGVYEANRANFNYEASIEDSTIINILNMFGRVNLACEKGLQSRGGQQLLNYPSTEPFDLIITEAGWGECFYGFIGKFGSPPVVAISAFGIPPWTSGFMGTSENPSYIPNFFTPYSSRMDFGQRILNFVMHNLVVFLYEYRHIPRQEAIARKYFKEDIPSFWRIERNFSIFLANILIGLDDPRPLSPNVIPIGGMHVKAQPDPLPQDLVEFLDEAKDGFIFFSLGSNLRSDAITKDKLQVLLDAFSELPQRVLWKFESDSLLEQPSNVMIGKWLPQSDILGTVNQILSRYFLS
ncbi:hypothetical protein ANN_20512 [Periplaneta americana]|uniref:UDP-glycosyltransferase n=1 Tax=Periplaneta americana TaxID=6978 RepID=A0ABQ8SCT1_PERAM|nr:hypothetical protein ANN_20512 [Periplaneta americana]